MLTLKTRRTLEASARIAVRRVTSRLDKEHIRKGGICRLFYFVPEEGMEGLCPLFESWIGGRQNIGKRPKYTCLAPEKGFRLALNARLFGHISSAQSAKPENHQYQGAVRVRVKIPEIGGDNYIWVVSTFSGLPADADERVSLLIPALIPWQVKMGDIENVVNASGNVDAYRQLVR